MGEGTKTLSPEETLIVAPLLTEGQRLALRLGCPVALRSWQRRLWFYRLAILAGVYSEWRGGEDEPRRD